MQHSGDVPARGILLEKLAMYHTQHRVESMLYVSDENWESNKDYFHVELLSALGLLVTPATLLVCLGWHLLADPPIFQAVVAEVRNVKTLGENPKDVDKALADGVDLRDTRNTCPKFAAAFYETLRLRMTGLPRIARHDFDFDVPWSSKLDDNEEGRGPANASVYYQHRPVGLGPRGDRV